MGGKNNLSQVFEDPKLEELNKDQPKKPRAFVEHSDMDIFDFSDLKKNLSTNQDALSTQKNLGSASLKKSQSSSNKDSGNRSSEADFQLGVLFQGKNNAGKSLNLNAKKVDIDFDSMDFFNAFEPDVKKKPVVKEAKEEKEKKEVAKDTQEVLQ
jgi:hypothetical protein